MRQDNQRRFSVLGMLRRLLEEGPSEWLLRNEALTRRGAEKRCPGQGDPLSYNQQCSHVTTHGVMRFPGFKALWHSHGIEDEPLFALAFV